MNIIQRIKSWFGAIPLTVNRKIALKNCAISDIAENEAGEETGENYNYYLYIHPSGRSMILRMNSAEIEFRYAIGLWSNRQNLEYKKYSQVGD